MKLTDFGIAKRIGLSTTTHTGWGTVGFMAPEVLKIYPAGYDRKRSPSLLAVDIWALGEIVFQLLIKRPVFDGLRELVLYVQGEHLFPTEALLPLSLSEHCCSFIQNSMAANPSLRPSVSDLLKHAWFNELEEAVSKESHAQPNQLNHESAAFLPASSNSFPNMTSSGANPDYSQSWMSTISVRGDRMSQQLSSDLSQLELRSTSSSTRPQRKPFLSTIERPTSTGNSGNRGHVEEWQTATITVKPEKKEDNVTMDSSTQPGLTTPTPNDPKIPSPRSSKKPPSKDADLDSTIDRPLQIKSESSKDPDLDSIIDRLLEVRSARPGTLVQLLESEICFLCKNAREIFMSQPVLLELEAPTKVSCRVPHIPSNM